MQYKGQYNDNLMYSPGDVVLFESSSFVARKMTRGEQPSLSSPCWSMVAAGGQSGRVGDAGANGKDGKDGAGVPVGGTVGQVLSKATGSDYDTAWATIDVSSIGASPALHKHSCSDIIDLPGMMDTKSDKGHTHSVSDLVGLDRVVESLATSGHKHFAEDITGGNLDVEAINADSIVVGQTVINERMISSPDQMTIHVDGCDAISITRGIIRMNGALSVNSMRVSDKNAPSSSDSPGVPGDICWDQSYLYICIGKNNWKRTMLSSW